MKGKSIRSVALSAVLLLLAACTAGGPSNADIEKVLVGSTHMMVGHGFAHSGFLTTQAVDNVERGKSYKSDAGIEVYPIRARLSGGGKEGQFTYLFYKNNFGEWQAQESE